MLDLLADGMSVEIRVTGNSMSPCIRGRDVVTLEPIADQEIHLGDVVAFQRPDGRLVIHRIVALDASRLRTRGDAASAADAWIQQLDLIGRVEKIERHHQTTQWGLGPARTVIAMLSRAGLLRPLFWPLRRAAQTSIGDGVS